MIIFRKFRFRVLPFAIVLTMLGIGMRTADLISMAVTGTGVSAITPAAAESSKDAAPAKDAAKDDKDAKADPAKKDGDTKMANADAATAGMPSHPPVVEPSQQENELLSTLTEKHKALDERGQQMDQREALLNAAEDRVNKKIEELTGMRGDLEKLLDLQKTKDDAQLASLVKIYENMKPKDAASIFDQLELPVLVDVTSRMKEAKLAPVLAAMSPERARLLTVKLADHRKNMEGAVADAKAALGPDAAAPTAPDAAIAPDAKK